LPPERTDFEDKVKAEKAFTEAKFAAILWQSRPPTQGLGWIKMKEKEAPPPPPPGTVPAAIAKPAVPAKPGVPAAPAEKPAEKPAEPPAEKSATPPAAH